MYFICYKFQCDLPKISAKPFGLNPFPLKQFAFSTGRWWQTQHFSNMMLNMSYCYLRIHNHSEALRCLEYGLELAPIAADCYFRRSQVRLYNKKSTVKDLRLAMDDANKALERRPKDKIYHKHKALVE